MQSFRSQIIYTEKTILIICVVETFLFEQREKMEKDEKKYNWLKWFSVIGCLCLVVGLVILAIIKTNHPDDNPEAPDGLDGTLPGASKIYPTVMVDGRLYEWRKGVAISYVQPTDSIYYGEVNHVDGNSPTKDCEFVSVFSVSGQIYVISENDNYVYLRLTTDWLDDVGVYFDLTE